MSSASEATVADHEVYRDAHGIPHLRAAGPRELAYAQGRITALDRAWQLETARHRAQGSTAAFLGPAAVAWDRFARQARLADTARRCFDALDPETADWVRAYVAGVNAGLTRGAARDPRFADTGLSPTPWDPWVPLAVWVSTHILFAGFPTKLWRDRVARTLGDAAVPLFAADHPGSCGSNGWLVPGDRTVSGSAILAGDPHRTIEDPGVYQQIRLCCPEYDVLGLAVPGVPGIAHFGHTGTAAWAITNAMADYHDLYVEELREDGHGRLLARAADDTWEPVARHTETLTVKDGETFLHLEVEVLETAHGPVVVRQGIDGAEQDLSLRYPPRVCEDLGFAALPALLRARTVADVDRALDGWAEPVNVVLAADSAGGLLHRVAGAVPLRDPANRLRPVPAWEPQYAWQGWAATVTEPVQGFAVMANARGIASPYGVEFAPGHRAHRIRELLSGSAGWSAKDMAEIHRDTHLAAAGPLLAPLPALDGLGPAASAVRERLLGWDRRMAADSTDAALFAAYRSALARRIAADPLFAELAGPPTGPEVLHDWQLLLPKTGYALEGLLISPLLPELDRTAHVRAALEDTAATFRDVPWSELHRLAPWQALPDPGASWPGLAGDHDCVNATSSVPGVTDLIVRASAARYVWDLARREDSLWVVPLGADGVPGDPHHQDQLPLWARGELVPVVTDWDRLSREPFLYE
ncbi:penicillin acylase family protein [Streptomyces sp. NPDC002054]|uniref:penicillin acylase family protein n=1 Tax=Streptomyces sp. NPDC002054 TaxID=3154663 RepID=UPI00331EDFBB